jgi:hypothetical protein
MSTKENICANSEHFMKTNLDLNCDTDYGHVVNIFLFLEYPTKFVKNAT